MEKKLKGMKWEIISKKENFPQKDYLGFKHLKAEGTAINKHTHTHTRK